MVGGVVVGRGGGWKSGGWEGWWLEEWWLCVYVGGVVFVCVC